jgi:hypothetical protein
MTLHIPHPGPSTSPGSPLALARLVDSSHLTRPPYPSYMLIPDIPCAV